ncbi:phospholipid/cholesterol/gamma-HCH transport system substrate-binding protein [Duganella sp. SG902]|uniref:MlaD family protein n=1 Tax=Duganella sp. SG902 TaxID=2587016 RepID=UPI00159DCB88|nr:MlaD family protein [Duganella sp. SG902]NVM74650.1 phospholipid/cholesterol/gamma-HCH transport system substrate-binding protein [Duganella sp. SG902]
MTEQNNEAAPVRNAEFKAAVLLVLMVVLVLGSAVYLLYARGAFEATQTLILQADDSEGVVVGMDVTFAGFPIGRVRRIELSPEGKARVVVDVPREDAHWLRSSSIFTLERGLVGGAKLRAFTGIPTDPPLEDGAMRSLLVGDPGAEIPRLLAAAKDLLQNLNDLTAENSALAASLANVAGVTGKLNGPHGAMGLIAGDDKNAQQLSERANKLLVTVNALAVKADSLIGHADERVFGQQGTIIQLNGLLADARNSLKKMDAVLVEAQAVASNTKEATADLGALRGEVESSLRRVEQLVNEINRKWPFKRDTEIKLP